MTGASSSAATTRQSLESFNWNVSYRSVFDSICGLSSFIFVGFTLALGIPKEKLGLLASIASFACLFQMIGLLALRRIADKKRFTIRLALLEPLILAGSVLVLPLLPPGFRFPFLALAVLCAAAALNLTRPVTDDWLAASIPGGIRARYLGKRLQLGSLVLILTLTASGWLAKGLDKHDPHPFSLFLAMGALFGLLAAFALGRAHLPEGGAAESFSRSALPAILRNRAFIGCILLNIVYNVPFWFAMPYYQVFNLRVLHMSEFAIALMYGLYYIIKIAASPLIGRWIGRVGSRAAIFWCTVPYTYFFFSFTLSRPDRVWPLWVGWMAAAFADTVFSLALTSSLYDAIPRNGPRKTYFVLNNLTVFAAAGILTACAAALTMGLKDVVLSIGPWQLDQFHILFLGCAVAIVPFGFGSAFFLPAMSNRRNTPCTP